MADVALSSFLVRIPAVAVVRLAEVFELSLKSREGGASVGVLVPALQHDFVKCTVAVGRHGHAIAALNLTQNFGVGHACEVDF